MSSTNEEDKVEAVHTEVSSNIVAIDPVAERKLLWKIDLYLMPSFFVLYLFSYVDRSNIGLAKVAGMDEDLNLSSNGYYIAVILWVIGYTVAAVPSNMILTRTRPSIFIPVIMFGWGAVATLQGAARNASHLFVLRFFLGVFEAGFSPAVIFLFSTWYKKGEQSKRFLIFLTAGIFSGAFGSIVSGAITSTLDGVHGITGWKWLFIVEGVATAAISLIVHWALLDYPHKSRGLSSEEIELAQLRLANDGVADTSSDSTQNRPVIQSFLKAVFDWRSWILVPAYMSIIGALAIAYFYPTLINGLGYGSTAAQYMTAPLYFVALSVAIPVCIFADHKPHLRGKLLVANLMIGMVFFALIAGIQNYVARYIFLCFVNITIWTGNALGLSFATTALRTVDRDVRAIMLAMMNGLAALAQLYGSALFPSQDAPQYLIGFSVFAATFAVGAILYGVADILFKKHP